MNDSILKIFQKIEIAWSGVWIVLLLLYYFCIIFGIEKISLNNFEDLNLILFQYVLQTIFIISAFISLVIFIIKNFQKNPNLNPTENDLIADGGRLVFPIVNIVYYLFDFLQNVYIKTNFSYLWLILPWLLLFPIVFELSASVKQQFSWIK